METAKLHCIDNLLFFLLVQKEPKSTPENDKSPFSGEEV